MPPLPWENNLFLLSSNSERAYRHTVLLDREHRQATWQRLFNLQTFRLINVTALSMLPSWNNNFLEPFSSGRNLAIRLC